VKRHDARLEKIQMAILDGQEEGKEREVRKRKEKGRTGGGGVDGVEKCEEEGIGKKEGGWRANGGEKIIKNKGGDEGREGWSIRD